ncbi:AMP-binding protein [Paucibacter sp. B2R-40]|uniref:AMP-binding protein n=1 Tax=Paucibacter sp. B2R-40 TaxID=2893554 RepID=UPI0021E415CC|nr:AMP-binding protein [Paucibacter sp. B2R-40]MCV2354843.1 AMP-binding protein [Paucibacter sp. B2R-40]
MERVWLNDYPAGVPPEVNVGEFASLADLLLTTCGRFAGLAAFSSMGVQISYAELERESRAFAAWLQQSLALRKGERLAIMLPNLLQYPVAMFGALRAGLIVVNVNPQYTATELEHQLLDSGAAAIVVLENFAQTVQQVLQRNPALKLAVVSTEVGDMFPLFKQVLTNAVLKYVQKKVPSWRIPGAVEFNAALRAGHALSLQEVPLAPADIAFLQYTGGTTGVAKGAMLSHGNMVANVQQVSAWIGPKMAVGKETFVCPLPLYHIYALCSSLVFLKIGALNILVANPRDMPSFIHTLKQQPFTAIIGVNTLYRALLDAPGFIEVDTRSLKMANAGGMAVQRVVAQRWQQATGIPIVESYGLTETSPGAIANPLDIQDWTGMIGMPISSTQACVLGEDGQPLAPNEVGEICLRGPQMMVGYWHLPQETALAFTREGWLRTGDMGFMDERGWFKLTDRKKDMIIVSGFKVFPNQIEDVVALHPGVAEVAAIGVADERSGEVVKIVVVRSDAALTAQTLLAHCRQHLTGYKMPKFVEFRDEPLPKSNLGKILRRLVRDGSLASPQAGEPAP